MCSKIKVHYLKDLKNSYTIHRVGVNIIMIKDLSTTHYEHSLQFILKLFKTCAFTSQQREATYK